MESNRVVPVDGAKHSVAKILGTKQSTPYEIVLSATAP